MTARPLPSHTPLPALRRRPWRLGRPVEGGSWPPDRRCLLAARRMRLHLCAPVPPPPPPRRCTRRLAGAPRHSHRAAKRRSAAWAGPLRRMEQSLQPLLFQRRSPKRPRWPQRLRTPLHLPRHAQRARFPRFWRPEPPPRRRRQHRIPSPPPQLLRRSLPREGLPHRPPGRGPLSRQRLLRAARARPCARWSTTARRGLCRKGSSSNPSPLLGRSSPPRRGAPGESQRSRATRRLQPPPPPPRPLTARRMRHALMTWLRR